MRICLSDPERRETIGYDDAETMEFGALFRLFGAFCLVLGLSVSVVAAATLTIENDRLIGATDVNVNGTLYDVEFKSGLCSQVFGECTVGTTFTFDREGAKAASEALVDQVFVDVAEGDFDSDPSLILDNTSDAFLAFTPYAITAAKANPLVVTYVARNAIDVPNTLVCPGFPAIVTADCVASNFGNTVLYSFDDFSALAVWSPSSTTAVPLPAGCWLLLSGLAGMSLLRHRKLISV